MKDNGLLVKAQRYWLKNIAKAHFVIAKGLVEHLREK